MQLHLDKHFPVYDIFLFSSMQDNIFNAVPIDNLIILLERQCRLYEET